MAETVNKSASSEYLPKKAQKKRIFPESKSTFPEQNLTMPSATSGDLIANVMDSLQTPTTKATPQLPANRLKAPPRMTLPFGSVVQTKLTIGEANDRYEQEADRVAKDVVQRINSSGSTTDAQGQHFPHNKPSFSIQRHSTLQNPGEKSISGASPPAFENRINRAKTGGRNLTPGLQQKMGNAMGADFRAVKIHTGREADNLNRSIQAKAFTTGRDIFFRQGTYNPSTRVGQELIAHELTHVVQQNGHNLPQIQSKSDPSSHTPANISVGVRANQLQCKFVLSPEQVVKATSAQTDKTKFVIQNGGKTNFLNPNNLSQANLFYSGSPYLSISDDGHLAVEERLSQAKNFFARSQDVNGYNQALETAGSNYRLLTTSNKLKVPDLQGDLHNLVGIVPKNVKNNTQNYRMTAIEQCIEMAESVIGGSNLQFLPNVQNTNMPQWGREGFGNRLAAFIGQYATSKGRGRGNRNRWEREANTKANYAQIPNINRRRIKYKTLRLELKSTRKEDVGALSTSLQKFKDRDNSSVFTTWPWHSGNYFYVTIYNPNFLNKTTYTSTLIEEFGDYIKSVQRTDKGRTQEPEHLFKERLREAVKEREDGIFNTLNSLNSDDLENALRELGLNEYVSLQVGQAFGITSVYKSDMNKPGFPYHWAGVVAKSGDDVITLENFARHDERVFKNPPQKGIGGDPRWYFGMYGKLSKVAVDSKGNVTQDENVDDNYWKQGTFHGQWKSSFGNGPIPLTIGVKKKQ